MPKKQIFHNETDAFFQERWQEKMADEGGRNHRDKNSNSKTEIPTEDELEEMEDGEAINIYLEIVESIGDDEELKPLLKNLESAILNYDVTIKKFQLQKEEIVISEKPSQKDKEESDLARRLAHNNLISVLSALSRAYVKKYGVNKWRYKIDEGRGDRDRIAKWAKDVAPYITQKT
jgi:hypothetical protein